MEKMRKIMPGLSFKNLILAAFIGFIFTLFFHYSLVLNINKPLGLTHGDSFFTTFFLKHYFTTAQSGNWSDVPNMRMAYGFKNSLFYSDSHLMQGIVAIPVNFLIQDIVISTNFLALLTIFFNYLSMFILAYFWTKHFWSSMLAGVIYAFNPFIMARFPDQLIVYSLQFIPLIFLFTEKTLRDPKGRSGFWLCLFLALQLISSSLYYSVFLLVCLPLYSIVRSLQLKTDSSYFFSRWNVAGIVLFISVTLTIGYFHFQVFAKEAVGRDIIDVESYSAWPTDYLFAGQRNFIYGEFKNKLLKVFPHLELSRFSSLNGLFLGITPIILLLLSFKIIRSSKESSLWLFWGLLVLSLVMSLGPKIHLTEKLTLPGPYRIVYEIPIFKFLRDVSKFGAMVVFFVSLISAFTLSFLIRKFNKLGNLLVFVVIILVVLEYWNKSLDFTYFDQNKIKLYQNLESNSRIKVILDYPIGNSLDGRLEGSRASEFDAYYLLLASTLHNKSLFNAYNSFLPKGYFQRTNQLSIIFPSLSKLNLLKKWGVDAIILHKDQFFIPGQFENIKDRLIALGLKPAAESDQEVLFNLYDWSSND